MGGRQAVLPRVSGRGWIYGFHRIGRDPTDPYPLGYMLSDTWGEGFDLISGAQGLDRPKPGAPLARRRAIDHVSSPNAPPDDACEGR